MHGGVTVGLINTEALISGSVSAQLSGRVTRSAEFTLPDTFYPQTATDLLAPERAIVQISTGIGYPDGSREIFPVFTGRVYEASQAESGTVTFRGDDLAADVVAFRFETPNSSQSGPATSTIGEIQRLIRDAYDAATFGTHDADDGEVPVLAWDEDRGQALDDLSSSLQSRWYALGNGDFVVRKYPYTATTPLLTLSDGIGGVVSGATRSKTRDGVTNSVTVVSERLDGTSPVRAIVRDNNAASPTYFSGLFGKVSQIITIQTPVDEFIATLLAKKQLVSSLALAEQWSASIVPDATLEPGDTVTISYRGASADQVLDSITYPLTADGTMAIQGRASIPEPILTDISDTGGLI